MSLTDAHSRPSAVRAVAGTFPPVPPPVLFPHQKCVESIYAKSSEKGPEPDFETARKIRKISPASVVCLFEDELLPGCESEMQKDIEIVRIKGLH